MKSTENLWRCLNGNLSHVLRFFYAWLPILFVPCTCSWKRLYMLCMQVPPSPFPLMFSHPSTGGGNAPRTEALSTNKGVGKEGFKLADLDANNTGLKEMEKENALAACHASGMHKKKSCDIKCKNSFCFDNIMKS